jgi:hypothetical protein
MFFGQNPFVIDENGVLTLALVPVIPGWMFTEEGTVTTTFLGSVKVVYHNPTKADTWKISPKSASMITVKGKTITSEDGTFKADYAELVRNLDVTSIDIYF